MRASYFDYDTRAIIDITVVDLGVCEINRINVPARYRGLGVGRQLMKQLLDDADNEGVTLTLYVNAYGDMAYQDLVVWYERCGFIRSTNEQFTRCPVVRQIAAND